MKNEVKIDEMASLIRVVRRVKLIGELFTLFACLFIG